MKRVEFEYFQLINGMMYPAKKQKGKLLPENMPVMSGVINAKTTNKSKPQDVSKIDTVTPEFSIEDDED